MWATRLAAAAAHAWIVCALVLLAGAPARAAEPTGKELRVAVLPFDSPSTDAQYATLGSGLQAMLTTDLAAAPELKLIERDKLAALKGELALQKSAAFDKATAVRIGKLLGATHLLTGAITVLAQSMRIDARLVDATTGEVVLADKIEGDKELFFEHEKALAQKLVAALGAPLTPKERARLAKIHTADLDAFRRFSDGIAAFDHQAFDDARKALHDALDKDGEFQLARLTLDDYEAIIAKLQERSDLLEAGERQQQVEATTARAAEQKLILDRLFTLAKSQQAMERLPAIYALARWHEVDAYHDIEMHATEDSFLLARERESFLQAYIAEAEKLFPKVPLFGTPDYVGRPPHVAEKLDEDQKFWLGRFFRTRGETEAQRDNALLEDVERGISSGHEARFLYLDSKAEARFDERAYKLGMSLDPDAIGAVFNSRPHWWRESVTRTLGDRYRAAGLFDESTRWYAEFGRAAIEPGRARSAADEVQRNRDIVKFLAEHRDPLVREVMMMGGYDVPEERWQLEYIKAIETKPLSPRAREVIANARQLRVNRDEPYVLLGDRPLFPLDGSFFSTGRRSDRFVASDLDYYRGASRSAGEEWWRAFFGGQHKGAMTARFALGYAPDGEWWGQNMSWEVKDLAEAKFVEARPEVVFLFGCKDIDVPFVEDADGRSKRLQRGLSGYGLHVLKDRIELVKVTQPEVRTGFSVANDRLAFEVLDSAEGAIADHAKVSLTVHGKDVSAKVGSLSVDETLPVVPEGFTGFAMLGAGHLAVIGPVVTIGK